MSPTDPLQTYIDHYVANSVAAYNSNDYNIFVDQETHESLALSFAGC